MIIVKNKSVSTPIFINRDNVKAVENVEGIEYITKSEFDSALNRKQDNLVSGKNIKTINGKSIVGEGDIVIEGGSDVDLSNYYTKDEVENITNKKQDKLVSGTNIKTINSMSLLGKGNISVATQSWVTTQIETQIGDIETALSNIIGN